MKIVLVEKSSGLASKNAIFVENLLASLCNSCSTYWFLTSCVVTRTFKELEEDCKLEKFLDVSNISYIKGTY